MRNRLEDLWQNLAHDGAMTPIGFEVGRPRAEVEDLMNAWMRERGQSIELGMLLKRSRRLISRLASAERVTDEDRRRARRLLLAIEYTLRDAESGEA